MAPKAEENIELGQSTTAELPSNIAPTASIIEEDGTNGCENEPLVTEYAKPSQASALENETKSFLGSGASAYMTAAYTPTLEEFQSVSFADYIRGTLLGVPLEPPEPRRRVISSPSTTSTRTIISQDSPSGRTRSSSRQTTVISTRKSSTVKVCRSSNHDCVSGTSDLSHQRTTGTPAEQEKDKEAAPDTSTSKPQYMLRARRQPSGITNDTTSTEITSKAYGLPCRGKLSDGVAKVTPPEGWWDRSGIAKDLTARGPAWQPGTGLGDMMVTGPIKQCVSGIGGIYEMTMLELPPVPLSEFRSKADAYRKRQIGSEVDKEVDDESMHNLARKFWRRLGPTMEAPIYGADMEGSLFQGADACGWNVDRLESCLSLLRSDAEDGDLDEHFKLPGVTSAYLYFGMWASVFAAHTEDMNLLSINYLHAGAPKYWYAISPEDKKRFESLAVSHFASAASSCGEFLRHKRYMLSPSILKKAGIGYSCQIQRAGDVMITFPGSYHFGFNTGFNVAESTNFAVPEWVPSGVAAGVCMCHPHSVRIDMNRFTTLLRKYDREMAAADKKGEPRISYSKWAKLEAKRRVDNAQESDSEDDMGNANTITFRKGRVVEVMRWVPEKSLYHGEYASKKKPPKSSKKVIEDEDDWRMALRVKASMFTPGTPVLCFLPGDNGPGSEMKEKYFTGTVSQVVERHARCHFANTPRKDDIWLAVDGHQLFMDGGSAEPPAGTSVKITSKRQSGAKAVTAKKKLRT